MLLGFAIESQTTCNFFIRKLCAAGVGTSSIIQQLSRHWDLRPLARKNHQSHLMAGENMTIITEKAIEFAGGLTVYTFCLKRRFKSLCLICLIWGEWHAYLIQAMETNTGSCWLFDDIRQKPNSKGCSPNWPALNQRSTGDHHARTHQLFINYHCFIMFHPKSINSYQFKFHHVSSKIH